MIVSAPKSFLHWSMFAHMTFAFSMLYFLAFRNLQVIDSSAGENKIFHPKSRSLLFWKNRSKMQQSLDEVERRNFPTFMKTKVITSCNGFPDMVGDP